MSQLVSIVYKPVNAGPDPADRYLRVPLGEALLVKGHGIKGDQKGLPHRQLNVMAAESLAALGAEGYRTGPGQMGEQLVVSGLDLSTLAPGTRLQIGASACIAILKPRTGCARLMAVQGQPIPEGRLGVVASVVAGGAICVGDSVTLLQPELDLNLQ